MKKLKGIILLLGILGLCTSCSAKADPKQQILEYQARSDYYRPNEAYQNSISDAVSGADIQDVTEAVMTDYFRDLYGMSTLKDQRLYWDGSTIQLEYEFPLEVPAHEIDAARSFALKRIVMGIMSKGNPSPYEWWLKSEVSEEMAVNIICKVMAEGNLLYQDNYASGSLSGSYENRNIALPARTVPAADEDGFRKLLEDKLGASSVLFQRSLTENALVVLIDMEEMPPVKKLEQAKDYVHEAFAKENSGFSSIILSMLYGGEPVFQSVYFNRMEHGAWVEQSWLDSHKTGVYQDASMYVTEAGDGKIGVAVENRNNVSNMFGEYYAIEWFFDGNWHTVPYITDDNIAWNDIGYLASDRGQHEWSTEYEWLYGSLPPGKYRIVKDIFNTDISPIEEHDISAEFYID